MSVERWIFSNANLRDHDLQEYQIRLSDGSLKNAYRDCMIELSNRLISVINRRGDLRTQRSWFAGRLTPELYVVALAGEQNSLMGTNLTGSRGLFCVLAYAFTGTDIRLYKKDEALFEPLKKLMEGINETGQCPGDGLNGAALAAACRDCEDTLLRSAGVEEAHNILKSTPEIDAALWRQSMNRPAMMGLLSEDDAQRFLTQYPNGIASVVGGAPRLYTPSADAGEPVTRGGPKEPSWEEKEKQEIAEIEANTARMKQEREARRIAFEIAQKRAAIRNRVLLGFGGAALVIGAMVFLVLGGRG